MVVTLEATPVRPDEPALLAWARLAAEHPLRLGVAVGLLLYAVGGRGAGLLPGKDPPGKLFSRVPESGPAPPDDDPSTAMAETVTTPITPVVAVTDCPIFSGPRRSLRLGSTLGVDLGSQDMALAVSRDNRMPRASVIVTTAARHMIRISKAGEKIEAILVYGSVADPTLHPDFREIAENLRDLRNKWFAKAKLCLALDNPHLDEPSLRRVLSLFDRVYLRMEWGSAKTFTTFTGRKAAEYTTLMNSLSSAENLVIQARFLKGEGLDNTSEAEVKAWTKKVAELKPREVQLLRSEKGLGKKVKSVAKSRLTEIAEELSTKAGVPATVHEADSLLD
jgi:hypothetical protein